jgi:hypothetical protein
MGYISMPSSAIDGLMKRNFAPPADRLRSVIARLGRTPTVFAALRANVENPPKEFTDLSIRIAKGSVGYFKDTLAAWAKHAAGKDRAIQIPKRCPPRNRLEQHVVRFTIAVKIGRALEHPARGQTGAKRTRTMGRAI